MKEPANIPILQQARSLLLMAKNMTRCANAPRTTNKIRSSLKSVDGAIRHARCVLSRKP